MSDGVKSHKDLDVWKKSMDLATEIYKITKSFPKEEMYGLTSQIRRAVVSISANIAEGAARNSKKEFIQFLYISLGSLAELETELLIAKNIGYLKNDSIFEEIKIIRKMLLGLINSVRLKYDSKKP
ncbi:four helix bundle protein [Deferribacter abyssi]|uniref:four helix bundle protein n=1 Tax=Deferribacter abyssi TaxID=213806 RepID=UPI003C1BF26C